MGVYIKNAKMPSGCFECPLKQSCGIYAEFEGWRPLRIRARDCPLVEIKEPHGRLIDADAVVEVTLFDEEHEEYSDAVMSVDDALSRWGADIPPTIIEEETNGQG